MIVSFFYILFSNFVALMIAILPIGSLPTQIASGLDYVLELAYSFNAMIPVDSLLLILGLSLAFQFAILLFKVVNYIVSVARGR